jgi:dolichol-phosphate mannosyltransferase
MKFSLVIPAKNEAKRIKVPLSALIKGLKRHLGENTFEIIIVINNTTDDTIKKVKYLRTIYDAKEVKILDIGTAHGKGEAVLIGMQYAQGEIIGFVDADGASSVSQVIKLYKHLYRNHETDAAIASRYKIGSRITGGRPLHRYILSKIYNFLVRLLTNVDYFDDVLCGLKLFRKKAIKSIIGDIFVFGWSFDVNILAELLIRGYHIEEIPSIWTDKKGSNVSVIRYAMPVLQELFRIGQNLKEPKTGRKESKLAR